MAFTKGKSGNPGGRPKGSTLRSLLEPRAPELIDKLIEKALDGDTQALKICIDKLIPNIKSEPVNISALSGHDDLASQGRAVLSAMGKGAIEPDTAASILSALNGQSKLVETTEILTRLEALENEKHN